MSESTTASADFTHALPRFVIGHTIRTSNAIEGSDQARIPALWRRAVENDSLLQHAERKGDAMYAVLTDYESDESGEYTQIVGIGVDTLVDLPEGLVAVSIPQQPRSRFSTLGEMPSALVETWERIWAETRTERLARAFSTDVEIHTSDGQVHVLTSHRS